jgi:hypothetical protein
MVFECNCGLQIVLDLKIAAALYKIVSNVGNKHKSISSFNYNEYEILVFFFFSANLSVRMKFFDTSSPMTQWVAVMVRPVFVCTNLRVQCIPWFLQGFQCYVFVWEQR